MVACRTAFHALKARVVSLVALAFLRHAIPCKEERVSETSVKLSPSLPAIRRSLCFRVEARPAVLVSARTPSTIALAESHRSAIR